MVTSFLMVGQSNMAGRGNVAEVKRIVHDGKLLMLRNCKWIGMREPINYDYHPWAPPAYPDSCTITEQ